MLGIGRGFGRVGRQGDGGQTGQTEHEDPEVGRNACLSYIWGRVDRLSGLNAYVGG